MVVIDPGIEIIQIITGKMTAGLQTFLCSALQKHQQRPAMPSCAERLLRDVQKFPGIDSSATGITTLPQMTSNPTINNLLVSCLAVAN